MASKETELAAKENRLKLSTQRQGMERRAMERTLVQKGTLITTAALYGAMNRMAVPIEIAGFPWKLAVAAGSLIGQGVTKGNLNGVFAGISDATMAIYVERSVTTGSVIAGDDDDDDDEPESDQEV